MKTIMKLIKIRFDSTKKIIYVSSFILGILFLTSSIISCYTLISGTLDIEYKIVRSFDATFIFILFTLLLVFYRIAFYANNNSYYSVFPTDGRCRYFSNQMINYICIIVGMLLLVIYRLLIRLICTAFCAISGKAAIVSNYYIGYELYGLLCTVLLLFILIESYNIVITLVQSFGKKGTITAGAILIVITILVSFFLTNETSERFLLLITDFITKENNALMFVVKLATLWAVLALISILVNKMREYNVMFCDTKDTLKLIVKVLYSIGFLWAVLNIAIVVNADFSPKMREDVNKSETITISLKDIDINKLEVKAENFPHYNYHNEESDYFDYGIDYIFGYTDDSNEEDVLSPFSIDSLYSEDIRRYIKENNLTELKFDYSIPTYCEDCICLADATDEELSIDVQDNTITIRRNPTKIRSIMIVSTWIGYSNLDVFSDLNVNRNKISSSSSSSASGYVHVE